MGAAAIPRRSRELADELSELEDAVKDIVYLGRGNDAYMNALVGFAVTLVQENRTIESNPLNEPYFFNRYIRRWVKEALGEVQRLRKEE